MKPLLVSSLVLLLAFLSGCGLRDDWVHPRYAPHSDKYFADRDACMHASYMGIGGWGQEHWSRDRFDVCMQAGGWRHP
jgi:hypothetical protein